MSRQVQPLYVADLSDFTKALRRALIAEPAFPGHQKLMTMIAGAAGFRNIAHLQAAAPAPPAATADPRALRVFDAAGRMTRWPSRTGTQALCLWVLWSRVPARRPLTEAEVNAIVNAGSAFRDPAQLRRSMIEHGLLERTRDGRVYMRIESAPSAEALAMIRAVPSQAADAG